MIPPKWCPVTGDETPLFRALGRLEGRMEGIGERMEAIEKQVIDSAAKSSAEHAEVGRKIEGLRREVGDSLEKRDKRIDELESDRDKASGGVQMVGMIKGAILFLFGVIAFVLAGGKP